MKKIIFSLITILSFVSISASAQVTQQWLETYNGPANNDDFVAAIVTDNGGNVYVTGQSNSGMITGNDFATIKYSPAGVELWASRYEGGYDERPVAMCVDNTGHVYVTGKGFTPATFNDYLTVKYNPNGDTAWVRTYNGTNNNTDNSSSIAVDNQGNVYVTGSSVGTGSGFDIVTLKYNSSGSLMWTDRYNFSGTDLGNAMVLDTQGNIYVGGSSDSAGEFKDIVAIKLNPSGGRVWVGRFTGSNHSDDLGNAIAVDASGNAYVTGQKDLLMITLKFNGNGAPLWSKTYTGAANSLNFSYNIVEDGTGNIYTEGYARESTNIYDYTTIKYSSSGTELWVRTYNANLEAYVFKNDLELDAAGNIYVAGPTGNAGLTSDYLVMKYDPAGNQQWTKTYNNNNSGDDEAVGVVIDNSTNDVIVTGTVQPGSSATKNFVTIKYSQTMGINIISTTNPEKFSLSQNYPNPFNPTTKLEFGISELGFVSLKVYDLLGHEVSALVNEKINPGSYSVHFDGSNCTSGIYFYKLVVNGNVIDTKRMILLK